MNCSSIVAISRRVRGASSSWPMSILPCTIVWMRSRTRSGVGSFMARVADSQESASMTMAVSRVWGLGPG